MYSRYGIGIVNWGHPALPHVIYIISYSYLYTILYQRRPPTCSIDVPIYTYLISLTYKYVWKCGSRHLPAVLGRVSLSIVPFHCSLSYPRSPPTRETHLHIPVGATWVTISTDTNPSLISTLCLFLCLSPVKCIMSWRKSFRARLLEFDDLKYRLRWLLAPLPAVPGHL